MSSPSRSVVNVLWKIFDVSVLLSLLFVTGCPGCDAPVPSVTITAPTTAQTLDQGKTLAITASVT